MGKIYCMCCGEETGGQHHICAGKAAKQHIEKNAPNKEEIMNAITRGVNLAFRDVLNGLLYRGRR